MEKHKQLNTCLFSTSIELNIDNKIDENPMAVNYVLLSTNVTYLQEQMYSDVLEACVVRQNKSTVRHLTL